MRKSLLFPTLILFQFTAFAQTNPNDLLGCRERCGFASSANVQQRIQFYQSPSMNKYDVHYLKLDIAAEANNRFISGTAMYSVTTVATLDTFVMELRNNMTVDSVFINNVKLPFTRQSDHVLVKLTPAISAGTEVNVLYYYRGTASSFGVFAGQMASNGLVFTASLSESYQAREWFPAKQLLYDKIDSADIWITTSSTNKAGSNGLLKAVVDLPNNKKQYQWSTRYPMAYYLPSFSVGNYMEYTNVASPAAMAPATIPILHYVVDNSSYFNANKTNIDKTPAFLEKMSELFGLYPFKDEKYGHAHANIGGGMEHQTMSTMSGFSTMLIVHELAHQWFGNSVTCASWHHIWLNEGFASYAEYLMAEHLPGLVGTTPATYMQSIHNDVLVANNGSVYVPDIAIFDENRIFSGRFSYNKGSAILHTLRFEMQDDAKFYQTLRTYLQQYKDDVATADNFKAVAEAVCGRSFSDFFDQWYYGQGYPTFNVDCSKIGDSLVLSVNHTGSAPFITPTFKGLYEFKIHSGLEDTTVLVNITANNQQFKFRSNRTPTGVTVDPNNWVLNKTGSITTGVDDINVSSDVVIFPNPASDMVHLKFPANWFESISLFDISGRLVESRVISRGVVDYTLKFSHPAGVYMVRLNGKGKVAMKKLVVN